MTTSILLADGTRIDPTTGRPVRGVKTVEVPSAAEAVNEITRVRKRIADLPDVPEKMNAVSVVAMYHLFGLDDKDIALVTNLSENQVANIMMTAAFTELLDVARQNIVQSDGDQVRGMLSNAAVDAAQNMVDLMDSNDDKVAIVAAKDVLDRAGHRPSDVVEHRHKVEGGLTIEYVKRNANEDAAPILEVDYKEIEDGDSN